MKQSPTSGLWIPDRLVSPEYGIVRQRQYHMAGRAAPAVGKRGRMISHVGASTPQALTAGTIAASATAAATITVTQSVAPSGGTGSITVAIYRHTATFTPPGTGTLIGTSFPCSDTGRTAGVTYYYESVYTDALAATANSNEVSAATAASNEPSGMTTYVDQTLNTLSGYTDWNGKATLNTGDADGGQEGYPNSIQANWASGTCDDTAGAPPSTTAHKQNGGLEKRWANSGSPTTLFNAAPKIAYVRWWHYPSSDFIYHSSVTKMGVWIGLVGNHTDPGNDPGSFLVEADSAANTYCPRIGFNYAGPAAGKYLSSDHGGSGAAWTKGAWSKNELLIDTVADTLQLWINGTLRISETSVNYGSGTQGVNGLLLNPYWGGGSGSLANSMYLKFSKMYLSGKNS